MRRCVAANSRTHACRAMPVLEPAYLTAATAAVSHGNQCGKSISRLGRSIDCCLPACLPGCLASIGWQDALAHSVVVCLFTACIIAQNLHKFLQNSRQQQEQHVVTWYIVSHVAASTTQANKQYYWKYVASATCCANICTCTRVFL